MRPEADVYSYVHDLEKHLQMTLFGGMADPEGAVLAGPRRARRRRGTA
jgi:hypothetical protein